MTPLNLYHQRQIVEAIACAERRTGTALMAVLARRADDYAYLPLFWAALLALALPCVLQAAFGWPPGRALMVLHGLLFIGLCLLLRSPRLAAWVVPAGLRHWQAARLARQQFAAQRQQGLPPAALMIFICEAERYVQILYDHALTPSLKPSAVYAIERDLQARLRHEPWVPGLLEAIERCAELFDSAGPPHAPRPGIERLLLLD